MTLHTGSLLDIRPRPRRKATRGKETSDDSDEESQSEGRRRKRKRTRDSDDESVSGQDESDDSDEELLEAAEAEAEGIEKEDDGMQAEAGERITDTMDGYYSEASMAALEEMHAQNQKVKEGMVNFPAEKSFLFPFRAPLIIL